MKNRRLKMTLLELLDASPRLKKRLASMSLSSGKPIFQIDGTDPSEIKDATGQMLPSIFFIKNLLKTSPEDLSKLRRKGQLISFLKYDSEVRKSFYNQPLNATLKDIHCCVLYSNIAPLINRLILGALSQAMSNVEFTIDPFDYLYWGSWLDKWENTSQRDLNTFVSDVGKDIYLSESSLAPFRFLNDLTSTGKTGENLGLTAESLSMGCDGTLLVGSVRYNLASQHNDSILKIQRKLLKSPLKYIAIDFSELQNNSLTVTSFVPLIDTGDSEKFKLCIILNNDSISQQLMGQDKAG